MFHGYLKVSTSQTELIIHSSSSSSFPMLFISVVTTRKSCSASTRRMQSSVVLTWVSKSFQALSSLLSTHCHCLVQTFNVSNFSSHSHFICDCLHIHIPHSPVISLWWGDLCLFYLWVLGLSWELVLLAGINTIFRNNTVFLSSRAFFSPSLLNPVINAYSAYVFCWCTAGSHAAGPFWMQDCARSAQRDPVQIPPWPLQLRRDRFLLGV